jgi:hypothetical protein
MMTDPDAHADSTEDALKRALLLGLSWVGEHVPEFAVDRVPSNPSPFAKENVSRLKPASELGLTLLVLARCGVALPFLDDLAQWLWRECDRGRLLLHLLLARNDFLPGCALYAPLRRLGFRADALDRVLSMLAGADMTPVLPLQPWSRLALQYNLWQLGLRGDPRGDTRDLYVCSRPEPWVVSSEIAYAVTHEVFYLSDFGNEPLSDARLRRYLRTWVPYWAKIFIAQRDYDVTAELAMVWSCVTRSTAAASSSPLLAILDHQQDDGSLAGPEGAGGFLRSPGDTDERKRFLANYHTTLVLVMAAAMTLRHLTNHAVLIARGEPGEY